MITPLPGVTPTKPGSRDACRSPASTPSVVDASGNSAAGAGRRVSRAHAARGRHAAHHLRRRRALPRARTGAGSPAVYFTGDGAKLDEDGYFWMLGRVDDVLNVAGHRIGTMEVESALVDHPAVAEAAVVGRAHELKGQALAAFVTAQGRDTGDPLALKDELKDHVAKKIGAIARPDDILFSADLPKTRSGQDHAPPAADIAEGRALGRHHDAGRSGGGGGAANLYDSTES